jgi:hypothetical protein
MYRLINAKPLDCFKQTMSKKHHKVLSSIFSSHPGSNIHWKEIESLLSHLGAEFREGTGASTVATIDGKEFTMHRGSHGSTISKQALHDLKRYLESVNITKP